MCKFDVFWIWICIHCFEIDFDLDDLKHPNLFVRAIWDYEFNSQQQQQQQQVITFNDLINYNYSYFCWQTFWHAARNIVRYFSFFQIVLQTLHTIVESIIWFQVLKFLSNFEGESTGWIQMPIWHIRTALDWLIELHSRVFEFAQAFIDWLVGRSI